MKAIQVGLLGIGTVGSGTFNVLQRNQAEILRRAGRGIEITMVADLDIARAQAAVGEGVQVVSDARENALYFSRSPIPFVREPGDRGAHAPAPCARPSLGSPSRR